MNRHRAYDAGQPKVESTYNAIPNNGLVRVTGEQGLAPEYMRIAEFEDVPPLVTPHRELQVINDTFIEMNGHQAELIGDARFMFNALVTARREKRRLIDLANYGTGFRGMQHESTATAQYAQLVRPIQALDAFALTASGAVLVQRARWSEHNSKHASYEIKDDVAIRDVR